MKNRNAKFWDEHNGELIALGVGFTLGCLIKTAQANKTIDGMKVKSAEVYTGADGRLYFSAIHHKNGMQTEMTRKNPN